MVVDAATGMLSYSPAEGSEPLGLVPLSVVTAIRIGPSSLDAQSSATAAVASKSAHDLTLAANGELFRWRSSSPQAAVQWLDALHATIAVTRVGQPPLVDAAVEHTAGRALEAASVIADDPLAFPADIDGPLMAPVLEDLQNAQRVPGTPPVDNAWQRLWTGIGIDKLLGLLETSSHSAFEDTSLGRDVNDLKE